MGATLAGETVHPGLTQGGPRHPKLEQNQPPSQHPPLPLPSPLGAPSPKTTPSWSSSTPTTDVFSVTLMMPFPKCHINGITQQGDFKLAGFFHSA